MTYNKGKGRGYLWVVANVSYDGDDCLPFPYNRLEDGYGTFGHLGKMHRAHVMMCDLAHGPAPTDTHEAAHNCGNGHLGCCNPRHLEWKTRSANQADRYRGGQRICKLGKPRVKLTLEQVEEIRRLRGQETQQSLADRFGVSRPNIIAIQQGKSWDGKKRIIKVLTAEQVSEIRSSSEPLAVLADRFGKSKLTIKRVKEGTVYKYFPNPSSYSSTQQKDQP